MSHSISRRVLYYTADDNAALRVVLHAVRQGQRGKNPSCTYHYYRNPRVALREALLTLGFDSLQAFLQHYRSKEMIHHPPPVYPLAGLLTKKLKPTLPQTSSRPNRPLLGLHSLAIVHPYTVKGFRHQLDRGRRRPSIQLQVADCRNRKITFMVRVTHDLLPGSNYEALLRGRIRMNPTAISGWKLPLA